MEKMEAVKKLVCPIMGMIGSLIVKLLGGWDEVIAALIVLMTIDFLSGMAAALVFKASTKTINGCLESKAMFKGLLRKGLSLSVVVVGSVLDGLAGTEFVRNAVIIGICAGEILSIVENMGLMGVNIPAAIMQGLEIFQSKK